MIEFHLDSRSGVSPYLQIVQQVRQALRVGVLREGDQLPTVKEVVGQLAINPNTVLKAYRELEHEGLASARPGVGTFVAASPGRQLVSLYPGDQVIARMPTEEERELLGTGYLTPVLVITRADGQVDPYNAAVTVLTSRG